jgi:ArsR family metal-binding transcriptional regulator
MAITVMEVLKNLPRTNCGDCGHLMERLMAS